MTARTWGDAAQTVIHGVIRQYRIDNSLAVQDRLDAEDEKAVRALLRDAYPFGERKYHPYKVWLREIKRVLGAAPSAPAKKGTGRGQALLCGYADPA